MNAQSKATAKWQAKTGYMTKGFKLKKDLCEAFAKACASNGESQASVITEFMKAYVCTTNATPNEKIKEMED